MSFILEKDFPNTESSLNHENGSLLNHDEREVGESNIGTSPSTLCNVEGEAAS